MSQRSTSKYSKFKRPVLLAIACSMVGMHAIDAKSQTTGDVQTLQPITKAAFSTSSAFVEPHKTETDTGKSSATIQNALQSIVHHIEDSVVILESVDGRRSLGTVITTGHVIGKRSELTRRLTCIHQGKRTSAVVVASHADDDLALIKVDRIFEHPISIQRGAVSNLDPGSLVVSATLEKNVLGVVSVPEQVFSIAQPVCIDCVDLGLTVGKNAVVAARQPGGNPIIAAMKVTRVYPRTLAERVGILVGDALISINGMVVTNSAQIKEVGQQLRVGQTIRIRVVRDKQVLTLSRTIERLSPLSIHDRWGGGPFSAKRFGFNNVIAHDSIISPTDCGGPILDLDGNVVGINISRSMRSATFAIGIDRVAGFIKLADPNLKLNYKANPKRASYLD